MVDDLQPQFVTRANLAAEGLLLRLLWFPGFQKGEAQLDTTFQQAACHR